MKENFASLSNTMKIVRQEVQSAPADTRLLGQLQQLTESERGKGEKLDKISDKQEESDRKRDEKLDKISQQLASMIATSTNGGQSVVNAYKIDALEQKVLSLENKNQELRLNMETCKAENGKAIAKMDTRFEPLEEFHTDAKARFAALQQKVGDAPTQDQISAIQQQIDNQSDQPSVGSIVFHCHRTSR